jgi:hypothetical protein
LANLLKIIAVGLVGVTLGLLVTIYALDQDRRGFKIGPWRGAPHDGTAEIDPYGLASVARAGVLPPGAAEGVSFEAATDSGGASLSPSCDYLVAVHTPAAWYWSLSALTPGGFPIANSAERYVLTSADVLRDQNEPAAIIVSARARPGNWLPVASGEAYVLMLRLYDSSLSAIGTAFEAGSMPTIAKTGCR